MNATNFISIEEASKLLNKSNNQTRKYIEWGYLSVQPGVKPARVSVDDVMRLKAKFDNVGKQSPYGSIKLAPNEYLKLWG